MRPTASPRPKEFDRSTADDASRTRALLDRVRRPAGAEVDEYHGVGDTPANMAAAAPDPTVVARVVEAQRRLAVAARARRAGMAALAAACLLVSVAAWLARSAAAARED